MATQSSVIQWAREHRTHHRNEERCGDPYNIKKGLWYAHIGWLLQNHDFNTLNEIKKTNISDLNKQKILKIQHDYYILLWILIPKECIEPM